MRVYIVLLCCIFFVAAEVHVEDQLTSSRRINLKSVESKTVGVEGALAIHDAHSGAFMGRLELTRERHFVLNREAGEVAGDCHFTGRIANVPGSLVHLSHCEGTPLIAAMHVAGQMLHIEAAKSNPSGSLDGDFLLFRARNVAEENLSHREQNVLSALLVHSGELSNLQENPATVDQPAIKSKADIAGMWTSLSYDDQEELKSAIRETMIEHDINDDDVLMDDDDDSSVSRKEVQTDSAGDTIACFPGLEHRDGNDAELEDSDETIAADGGEACAAPFESPEQKPLCSADAIGSGKARFIETKIIVDKMLLKSVGSVKQSTKYVERIVHQANLYLKANAQRLGVEVCITPLSIQAEKYNPDWLTKLTDAAKAEAEKKPVVVPDHQEQWLEGISQFVDEKGGRGKYDHVSWFSGYNFKTIDGTAYYNTACSRTKSVSLIKVKGDHRKIAFALVHEIFHNIGVEHDPKGVTRHIMDQTDFAINNLQGPGAIKPKFSQSSVAQFKKNFYAKKCLQDVAPPAPPAIGKPPPIRGGGIGGSGSAAWAQTTTGRSYFGGCPITARDPNRDKPTGRCRDMGGGCTSMCYGDYRALDLSKYPNACRQSAGSPAYKCCVDKTWSTGTGKNSCVMVATKKRGGGVTTCTVWNQCTEGQGTIVVKTKGCGTAEISPRWRTWESTQCTEGCTIESITHPSSW